MPSNRSKSLRFGARQAAQEPIPTVPIKHVSQLHEKLVA